MQNFAFGGIHRWYSLADSDCTFAMKENKGATNKTLLIQLIKMLQFLLNRQGKNGCGRADR